MLTMSLREHPRLRLVAYVVLYTLVVNVPFWIACRGLGLLPIGWFSPEMLFVGMLALFLPRWLRLLLLIAAFAEDILCAVSKTYYLTPVDCLLHAQSLTLFPTRRIFQMVVGTLIAIIFFAGVASFPSSRFRGFKYRTAAIFCLILFLALGVFSDISSIQRSAGRLINPFSSPIAGDENRFAHYRSLWFFRYATLRINTTRKYFATVSTSTHPDLLRYPKATSATSIGLGMLDLSHKTEEQRPNIVLIVAESWGFATDPSLREIIAHAYSQPDLASKYDIQQGLIPFSGSTVNGEVRELCDSTFGFAVERASVAQLHVCLPATLAALGYTTVAAHGMDGHLFLRSDWYRNMGFEDVWFRHRFSLIGLPQCSGAFEGICDYAVAAWMTEHLRQPEAHPGFLYWMTLNAHHPLPIPSGLRDPAACSVHPLIAGLPAFCSWYQFQTSVHQSVAKMALSTLNRPTAFVVVGDHAPPFANETIRSQFSQTTVPYVLLLPR